MPHIAEETVDCIKRELLSLDYRNIDKAKVEAIAEKIESLCVDKEEEARGGDQSKLVVPDEVVEMLNSMIDKLYLLKTTLTPQEAKLIINDLLDRLEQLAQKD